MSKKKEKKSSGKVNFLEQIKQYPYKICSIGHQNPYQRSVGLDDYKKYNILNGKLNYPVKSFDQNQKICETFHNQPKATSSN